MRVLSHDEIQAQYEQIKAYHKQYLAQQGVILPHLTHGKAYTKDALTLVYLSLDYPNTHMVSKKELTEFIRTFYPEVSDVQQARHLAAQKGWYILSGTRKDNASCSIPPGEYKLDSLEMCYPGFTAQRRQESLGEEDWEALKARYDYRCACCGSEEGKPHRYWKNTITHLQQGHRDPSLPLEPGNIIPQCEKCNRPDRNYWVYDDKGRVVAVANDKVIDSCSEKVQKAIYTRLYRKYQGIDPNKL